MTFDQIIGQAHIKKHLQQSVVNHRIPHAQLFVGKEGSGTLPMAIAYAQYLLCYSATNQDSCNLKCNKLQHPDLHFAFPVTTNDSVKKHPVSNLFLADWRTFIEKQPYGSLFNWLQQIGIENKQGQIGVDEAVDIVKKLNLKAYEGGFKVMIIWMAEKMNIAASNKLLKLLEEPPEKTVFLLISEDEEQLLKTITSRCQALNFPSLSETDIANALVKNHQVLENKAIQIAHQSEGNYNKAVHLLNNNANDVIFEKWFIIWIRAAFKAKGNAAVIQDLIDWSETIAKSGRETQKQFLQYCLQFFRQALLLNYGATDLVFLETKTANFKLEKFAPFVHSANILSIEKELNDAQYHIERNGNAKIILLDVSIKLTRLLHTKEEKII
ncbi:ATP-binding protein [Tenacibaculum piscium]|uniref:DNA polymerase III subunit delta n=1 Tax=Tenacibaculum piscium TaxID=1458515 RepID=A0A2H1YK38_9FLAO|nr:DNA polymerase III subunit delta' [Tenacibaculum piscium]MBE7629360.1 DNA polymerase III subunit delta' [Tenacibaculum piscium]MBE7670147.1 DNA polymerase III subunit delta' [Tenacibaculum piscium]SOS75848.1 DNA polymerase III subunit delta [Tenacibaculum piscium]